jgi:cell division protein FtsB
MQYTLTAKQSDDPHDVIHDVMVVAPDAVRVAPSDVAPSDIAASDDELAALLHQAARHHSDTQTRAAPDFAASPTVPPVDTTFRPAAVNDILIHGKRRSMARRAMRAFMTLLLAVCVGVAVFAWRSYGDAAKQVIAQWTPQYVPTASPSPPENPGATAQSVAPAVVAAPAVVQADAANAAPPQSAPPQPAPPVQSAPEAVAPAAAAPSPESSPLLQSMARDLASLGQEVEQLKASVEQLKTGQSQMSRDAAKAFDKASDKTSEQNLRPRTSAPPPRPPVARVRKPMPPYPPPQAAARPLPPTAAPYYVPRQPEPQALPQAQPQASGQQLTDPELASVPRPPMPVR